MISHKIKVLDKGYIILEDCMPHPTTLPSSQRMFQHITNAARTSFLGESRGYDKDYDLLKYLWVNKHTTPFEMIQLKFRVKLPIFVQSQWVRHRTMSYNIQSFRYREFDSDDVYHPDKVRVQAETNKQGSQFISESNSIPKDGKEKYEEYLDSILHNHLNDVYSRSIKAYQELIEEGVAKELARIVLPGYAIYSTMIVSTNLRNLLHWLRLREDNHAQYEMREYAKAVKFTLEVIIPEVIELYDTERN